MYEIWLGLNIAWEMTLDHSLEVIVYLLAIAALYVYALWRRPRSWRINFRPALSLGVLVAIVAFFALPGLTDSAFGRFHQWLDWALLAALAVAAGIALAIPAWPVLSLIRRQAPTLQP